MKARIKGISALILILLVNLKCDKDSGGNQFLCCSGDPFSELNIDNLDQSKGIVESEDVITPNGDGFNDAYDIENINLYPNNTVTITDLSNSIVFQKQSYENIT